MTEELTKIAADKLIEVFDTVTKSVAPAALELTEGAMVISGIQCVVVGFIILAIAILFQKEVHKEKEKEQVYAHLVGTLAIISVTFYVSSFFWLFNIWNWVAIFQPKLAIVNKILKF